MHFRLPIVDCRLISELESCAANRQSARTFPIANCQLPIVCRAVETFESKGFQSAIGKSAMLLRSRSHFR
jgi:hypothetical protein